MSAAWADRRSFGPRRVSHSLDAVAATRLRGAGGGRAPALPAAAIAAGAGDGTQGPRRWGGSLRAPMSHLRAAFIMPSSPFRLTARPGC